ncbi:MAG: hypothetical protein LBH15_03810 [Treponema sp.]|nr:hypothetical protein [Treponema sp.]
METVVVLDTESFRAAEREAVQLRVSLPVFCSLAIREFVQNHRKKSVTEQLNTVYAEYTARIDDDILQAQYDSLGGEDW